MKVHGGVLITGMLFVATGVAATRVAAEEAPVPAAVPLAVPAAVPLVAPEAVPAAVPAVAPVAAPDGLLAEHGGVETFGVFEMGWRAFVDRPADYTRWWAAPGRPPGSAPSESIAKFDEYGTIRPGPYLQQLDFAARTKDGVYWSELRINDYGTESFRYVGTDNYRAVFDMMKAGEHYFTAEWDQLPHLYSTSAQSIWNGVGTNQLTTNVALGNNPTQAQVAAALNANLRTIDIGIDRNIGRASYRWTPDPNWDFQASYSNDHRTGTQVAGAIVGGLGNQQIVQLPRPVDDTTQNAKASGQYFGDTPWGHFNILTSGGVSLFTNEHDSYTYENPFFSAANPSVFSPLGRVSLLPDNQAYTASMTTGVDLPYRTRYMGTFSYASMRQDEGFVPYTINPFVVANALPSDSADARIDTMLINNVLTTRVTDDVKATFRYRYYDNDNKTPERLFPAYVSEDSSNNGIAAGSVRRNLAYAYTKQNASEDVTWRVTKTFNVGATAAWERYDRERREVAVTDELSGKIYGDWRAFDGGMFKTSYLYSQRRYDGVYDPQSLVRYTYWSSPDTQTVTNFLMRKFDLADRDRHKAMAVFELDTPIPGLVVSPNAGLRFDDYLTDPYGAGELGILKDNVWNAGIEVAYAVSPGLRLMAAYVHEQFDRDLVGSSTITALDGTTFPAGGTSRFFSNMREDVDTVVVSANVDIVPDSVDLGLSYAIAHGKEDWTAEPFGSNTPCPSDTVCAPFPTYRTNYQRFEGVLRHKLDPDTIAKLGWSGDVTLKLRYLWERNQVADWQNDLASPYMYLIDASVARNIGMAAFNPNYDAQLVGGSVAFRW
ncbi:Outer membrane protein precursor [Rhodovulum sp. PH10]|uniref:MtrB/PioB family decaheme-associated outer membrane protein n=1 Tax=Rhodovulum sp. PH10 TaxID=1187851 RepID=UPI00027C1FF1|nr:MtrB/PioB family decaheme-associated outer membrane protein [Rhodovulum sp. PH10]EJW12403.1 Outer membrane protein precursor [Rhodovulum sp. PH10]